MGVLGAVVHSHSDRVAGVEVPWGLAVALVPLALAAAGARHVTRLGSVWLLLGWAAVPVFQEVPPGTGYLIADDTVGWSFMLVGLGVCVVAVLRDSRLGP